MQKESALQPHPVMLLKHIRSKPPRLLPKYPDLVFARTPLSEIQSANLIILSVLLKQVSLLWVAAFVIGYHQFSFYLEYEIFFQSGPQFAV